ncbi:MFS transporter, partial [Aromatoleum evansii]|nr:MFS transporter [Aromatoleum evansii]
VSLKDTFKMWPAMLVCGGLVIAWNVTNYMLTAYMPSFLSTVTDHKGGQGISDNMNNVSQIIVMAVCLAIIPLIGLASDRIGRKTIVRIGSVMLIVLAFPSLMRITRNTEGSVIAGLIIMGLSRICFSATMPSTLPSLFPTAVRAGALS